MWLYFFSVTDDVLEPTCSMRYREKNQDLNSVWMNHLRNDSEFHEWRKITQNLSYIYESFLYENILFIVKKRKTKEFISRILI